MIDVSDSELFLLDFDGVLVDSEQLAAGAVATTLTKHGWEIGAQECRINFQGKRMETILEYAKKKLPNANVGLLRLEIQSNINHSLQTNLNPVPGARRLLEMLNTKAKKYCIVSSSGKHRIALSLSRTGLDRYFDGKILSGDDVINGKPDPEIFFKAAELMGSSIRRSCTIEDSVVGLKPAHTIGSKTIYLKRDGQKQRGTEKYSTHTTDSLFNITL